MRYIDEVSRSSNLELSLEFSFVLNKAHRQIVFVSEFVQWSGQYSAR